jgi:membrane protein DedA with SNARE-associated domain
MEIVSTNSIVNLLYEHRYVFAFLGALFEGTFIMLLSGVLYKFGYFNFSGLIAVLLAGYFLNGLMWYLIGRAGGYKILDRLGRRMHLTRILIEKIEHYFKRHSIKTIFLTRITYGFSMYVLMIAGSLKMKWKKILPITFLAAIIWVFVMMSLGYVFGLGYSAVGRITTTIAVGLTIVIFAIIAVISVSTVYLLIKFVKKIFINDVEKEDSFLEKTGKIFNDLFKDN